VRYLPPQVGKHLQLISQEVLYLIARLGKVDYDGLEYCEMTKLEKLKIYLKALLAEVAKTKEEIEEQKLIKEFNDNCE
jgi:hypothetical protein